VSEQQKLDPRAVLSNEGTARAVLRESWEKNADAWTSAVREQKIPSRRIATDAAIVDACLDLINRRDAVRVLDVGCGEGWLSRALAAHGADVLGIDGSEGLIEIASRHPERSERVPAPAGAAVGGHPERSEGSAVHEVCTYEELRDSVARVPGPFDLSVCNFALLDDRVSETLSALRSRLGENGRLIVHTVHPWVAAGEGPYEDGWRLETFATFEQPFPSHMPWYFRTMGSWLACVRDASLRVTELREPLHPETRKPLSLLIVLRAE